MMAENLFSQRARAIKRSVIGALKDGVKGDNVISLGEGVPDKAAFPANELAIVAEKVLREQGRDILQYGAVQGYVGLREQLSQLMEQYGINYGPENIQVTTGSMQSLELATKLFLEPGDMVLVEDPTFIDAQNVIRFSGASVKGIPCDEEGIDLELLEKALKSHVNIKAIYVIPDFQNPTGLCWTVERRKAFMELVSKYGVVVFEDNPYGELSYTHAPYKGLAHYDQKGQVVFMGSLSKTLSPGMRLGWLAGAEPIIHMLSLVKEQSDIHSSIPDHVIAATYMKEYDYKGHVQSMCAMYKKRLDALTDALEKELPEFTFQKPEGGFFVWLNLPEGIDDMSFFTAALDEGVLVIPGSPFLVGVHNKSYIRVNFSGRTEEELVEAVKRMHKAYQNMIK